MKKYLKSVPKLPRIPMKVVAGVFGISAIVLFLLGSNYFEFLTFKAHVKYVDLGDASLAYYTRGTGKPLLLNAAFGMTMEDWDPVFIRELSKDHTVIVYDARGVGLSSGDIKNLTVEQMADDGMKLLHVLHFQKSAVLGWSYGSFVAQEMAYKYPDRVTKVILAATNPGGNAQIRATAAIDDHFSKNMGGTWESVYVPYLFPRTQAGLLAAHEYLLRRTHAVQTGEAPREIPESYEVKSAQALAVGNNKSEEERYEHVKMITAPVLVIGGDKDELTVSENFKKTAELIRNAKLIIVPDTGHGFLLQRPIEVARMMTAFLQSENTNLVHNK